MFDTYRIRLMEARQAELMDSLRVYPDGAQLFEDRLNRAHAADLELALHWIAQTVDRAQKTLGTYSRTGDEAELRYHDAKVIIQNKLHNRRALEQSWQRTKAETTFLYSCVAVGLSIFNSIMTVWIAAHWH